MCTLIFTFCNLLPFIIPQVTAIMRCEKDVREGHLLAPFETEMCK